MKFIEEPEQTGISVDFARDGFNTNNRQAVSAPEVISLPWIATQQCLLDTKDFLRQAKERGADLSPLLLRQLYKHRIIIPLVEVTDRRYYEPHDQEHGEPRANGRMLEFRAARSEGRLRDLGQIPFIPRLSFESSRPTNYSWWNGLLYSRYQLSIVAFLKPWLGKCRYSYRNERKYPRLPEPDDTLRTRANQLHRIGLMALALEARYLPILEAGQIRLTNTKIDEYLAFRRDFDPVKVSRQLQYSASNAHSDAECLLLLARTIDPTNGPWRELIKYATRESWKHLNGDLLSAMHLRETSEILLRFYEDLSERGETGPLPSIPTTTWHPLHDRLSSKQSTLDQQLMDVGLSPHPRVVLAVEGDSEEIMFPRVWNALGYSDAPELVRLLNLGGTDKNPVKVAGLAATPLVTRQGAAGDFVWMIKPPTCFMIVADPEGLYATKQKIDKLLNDIKVEIKSGLAAQGAQTTEPGLNELVKIHTWSAPCFEYEHFTDEELASAIATVHKTCNDWSKEELVTVLAYWRGKKKDIRRVWESGNQDEKFEKKRGRWEYCVSKTELTKALWPILEQKIKTAISTEDGHYPQIAQVAIDAHGAAQKWRHGSFVLEVID
ncbi:toprim domain-containing protein [Acidithrix ferrooxidans]|uniref:hypothetical protein n=1 Tax=Acidithrix ferrooxidans TaxID=1280514 RepID=UPI00136496DC|nr:hypothetical protein [Acidithrix ferrooxidans]